MSYDSVEAEEKFQEHLKRLSEMSPKEKREYAKILDAQEKRTETIGRNRMRIYKEVTHSAITAKGVTGVHRADLVI